jgi:cell pole-organizing protein PopZ
MSGAHTPPGTPGAAAGTGEGAGGDPSMEDILASIRRILSEEEPAAGAAPAEPAPAEKDDGVLVLDSSMMVPDEPEPSMQAEVLPPPRPVPPPSPEPPLRVAVTEPEPPAVALVAPEAAAAAATAMHGLLRTLAADRALKVRPGGATIEDIVREELRPLLKEWLDTNLPDMVERLVRAEIERVVGRAVP